MKGFCSFYILTLRSGTVDRPRGLADLAKLPEADMIVCDWISEADMVGNGSKRAYLKKLSGVEGLGKSRLA